VGSEKTPDFLEKETRLSQSFASAFNMLAPPPPAPKLMNTGDLADPGIGGCPSGGM
jgi:hypothetical protein